MKQRGWLMIGGAAALTLMSMQAAVAHESQGNHGSWGHNGYGAPPMGMPGQPGSAYGYSDGRHGPGYSHSGGEGYGHHGPQNNAMMGHGRFDRLDLNDKQRGAIRTIMRDARSAFRKLQNKLSDIRYAIYDLVEADKVGKESDKLADEMGDLMAERIKLRTEMRMMVNKVLTKDQREQARDMSFFDRGYGW